MLAAEASEKGFLITGGQQYLAGFNGAIPPIDAALNRLDALLDADPARRAIAVSLRQEVGRQLDLMRQAIAFVQAGKPDAARALAASGAGHDIGEALHGSIGALQQSVAVARHKAAKQQAHFITIAMVVIGFAAAGAIFLAVLATREVQRHLRLLQTREMQLDRLVGSLEARVARRTRALEEANQRFQIALDSARVTVFSQDRDLTYSWVSQSFGGLPPDQIVGKTDAEFLPPETSAALAKLKTSVIASGETARGEVRADFPPDVVWYELSLVPTRAADGSITGLIGGAVDISERKEYESHVRMLMREVTHRSKNLLAVVQALMRQTAAHVDTIEDFSARFAARLQSLAGAYDLLIKDDWRGTALEELVRSQLAQYLDKQGAQIEIGGSPVRVPPEATQNIGMALHELATNAAKYGALSVPGGRLRVHWKIEHDEDAVNCRIWWQESGGPIVTPPGRRGFGQIVIERTVARAVGGKVTVAYNETGLEWMLIFPLNE
jgi:PAS domain S-box-containing protein